jgi:hypothetical protein
MRNAISIPLGRTAGLVFSAYEWRPELCVFDTKYLIPRTLELAGFSLAKNGYQITYLHWAPRSVTNVHNVHDIQDVHA